MDNNKNIELSLHKRANFLKNEQSDYVKNAVILAILK